MNLELINRWTDNEARAIIPALLRIDAMGRADDRREAVWIGVGLTGSRRAGLVGTLRGRLARGVRSPSADRRSQGRCASKFATTAAWASHEQAGAIGAGDEVLEELAAGNRQYEERFGFIFIVCATGKTADEMLFFCRQRLPNDRPIRAQDRRRRADEDHDHPPGKDRPMSTITSHVLDTARGKPAGGITVVIEISRAPDRWTELARGVTDADGRIVQFTPDLTLIAPGIYRLRFLTAAYFQALGIRGFYPEIACDRPDRRPRPALSHPPALEPFWLHHVSRQLSRRYVWLLASFREFGQSSLSRTEIPLEFTAMDRDDGHETDLAVER